MLGDLARPAFQLAGVADMNDNRMVRRPAFHSVDARDRRGVGCVGAESVYRFGWERHEAAALQDRNGFPNRKGMGSVDG